MHDGFWRIFSLPTVQAIMTSQVINRLVQGVHGDQGGVELMNDRGDVVRIFWHKPYAGFVMQLNRRPLPPGPYASRWQAIDEAFDEGFTIITDFLKAQ